MLSELAAEASRRLQRAALDLSDVGMCAMAGTGISEPWARESLLLGMVGDAVFESTAMGFSSAFACLFGSQGDSVQKAIELLQNTARLFGDEIRRSDRTFDFLDVDADHGPHHMLVAWAVETIGHEKSRCHAGRIRAVKMRPRFARRPLRWALHYPNGAHTYPPKSHGSVLRELHASLCFKVDGLVDAVQVQRNVLLVVAEALDIAQFSNAADASDAADNGRSIESTERSKPTPAVPEGEWSRWVSKGDVCAAWGVERFRDLPSDLRTHGIDDGGNSRSKKVRVRLDTLDAHARRKIEQIP